LSCEARAADAECPIRVSLSPRSADWVDRLALMLTERTLEFLEEGRSRGGANSIREWGILDILVALNRHHPFPTAL
jgi:hypothetical protein